MWNAQKVGMEQERNGERSITRVDNRESCSINKPALKCDVVNVKYVWQCDQFVPYFLSSCLRYFDLQYAIMELVLSKR
jgi:hypothetical protein